MSKYNPGTHFERRCRDALEAQGWFVVRSAGSRGPADLVALRDGEIRLMQCKTDAGLLSEEERALLVASAAVAGGVPVLASRKGKRGPIEWEYLDGEERGPGPP